jgi:hypothetical protein
MRGWPASSSVQYGPRLLSVGEPHPDSCPVPERPDRPISINEFLSWCYDLSVPSAGGRDRAGAICRRSDAAQLINRFGELFCFRVDRFIARSISDAFTQRST